MDNGWQKWKFPQLVETLESWTLRNLITLRENKIDKSFKVNQFKVECIYCDQSDHKPADFGKVKSVSDRRKILSEKRLYFNAQVPNIVLPTAVATKIVNYANENTSPQFARNILIKILSQY